MAQVAQPVYQKHVATIPKSLAIHRWNLIMTRTEQIRDFLADSFLYNPDGFPLDDEDSLMANGVIDSTGILELTQFVEETFGLEVLDEEITPENFDSVNRIDQYVQRKQAQTTAVLQHCSAE
jgi:acyl carrier protein